MRHGYLYHWLISVTVILLSVVATPVMVYPLQPLWKGVLSAEERGEGKAALSELARRSQFMRSPRYKTTSFSNTAASGAVRDGKLAEVKR